VLLTKFFGMYSATVALLWQSLECGVQLIPSLAHRKQRPPTRHIQQPAAAAQGWLASSVGMQCRRSTCFAPSVGRA
jgi:hypothetical protein